jgi:hypothetical protein
MTVKCTVDVFVNGARVAFAIDRIALDRIPPGWRFSRTIEYDASPAQQGSGLTKILAGLNQRDFYILSEDEQVAAHAVN